MGARTGLLQGHPAMGPTQHLGTQGELELIDQSFAQQTGRQASSAQHQQSLEALGGEPGKQARPWLQREVSLEPWRLALTLA